MLCVPHAHAAPPGSAVLAAASDAHVWWIGEIEPADQDARIWVLMHRALLDEEPVVRRAWFFSRAPEAIAAYGREVWIAFGSEGNRAREVFQLAADQIPSSPSWVNASVSPSPRPPLPAGGVLRDFALTKDGAFACWSSALRDAPKLFRCDGSAWQEEQGPAVSAADQAHFELSAGVGVLGVDVDGSLLLAQARRTRGAEAGSHVIVLAKRALEEVGDESSPAWSIRSFALPERGERSLSATPRLGSTIVEGRLVLAVGDAPRAVECFDVRGDALLAWTKIESDTLAIDPPVIAGWIAVGMRTGARIFALQDTPAGKSLAAQIAPIDVARGVIGKFIPLEARTQQIETWIPTLLGLFAATLLLVALLLRPSLAEVTKKKPSTQLVASFAQRLLALGIDLLPGAIAGALFFDLETNEFGSLLITPLFALDLDATLPFCVMVAFGGILAMLVESISGASAGKWLVGIRVIGADGSACAWWKRLMRAFLTVIVLISPILALATLSHPRLRGVPELLTGTEVVRVKPKQSAGDAETPSA